MSLETRRSTSVRAPFPVKRNSPMCERSKRPARDRTVRCSTTMPSYWIDLAERGVVDLLALVGRPLGKDPRAVRVTTGEHDLALAFALADHDTAGRDRVAHAARAAGTDARHRV